MGLQISSRKSGDVVIFDLQGRATIGRRSDELSAELRKAIDGGNRKILVNLTGVSQVDSSGISTIVRNFVTVRRLNQTTSRFQEHGLRSVVPICKVSNEPQQFISKV